MTQFYSLFSLGTPAGIYIARLVTPEFTKSIKMVLLKEGIAPVGKSLR